MKDLKQKYIKLCSLFSLDIFIGYVNRISLDDRYITNLYNNLTKIEAKTVPEYFDELFDYVENHKDKAAYRNILQNMFNEVINLARMQLQTVLDEIDKLEYEADEIRSKFKNRYEKLLRGYFCDREDLDAMLEYFTGQEEFEKCERIQQIKLKYYERKQV